MPARSASCWASRAAAKAPSYWSRSPSVTALLICSSSRRSVSAGSAWVTARARSYRGSASAIRPAHRGGVDQHVQGPADGPVVVGLGRLGQGRAGHLVGQLDLAEFAVRPGDGHQQPGPVPAGDPGQGQGLVQRGQGFREPAGHGPALGQGPVQVDEEVGIVGGREAPLGYPLRLGRVADPVQGLGEAGRPGRHAGASPPVPSRPRSREVPRPPGEPGRPAAGRCGPASAGSTRPSAPRCRLAHGPPEATAGPPGRPVRPPRRAPGRPRGARRPAPGPGSPRTGRRGSAGAGTRGRCPTRPARQRPGPRRRPGSGPRRPGRARWPGRGRRTPRPAGRPRAGPPAPRTGRSRAGPRSPRTASRARARWSAPRFPRRRRSGRSCGPGRPPVR